jgi:hypothetical protein
MNRLIIIGNGFDIAHGIKSSFKDFITDYFCNAVNHFFDNFSYSDSLLEIKYKNINKTLSAYEKHVSANDVFDMVDRLKELKEIDFIFHAPLLKKTYSKIKELNWVDIETEFFNILVATKNAQKGQSQIEAIEKVNSQLELMKEKLIAYLNNQELQFSNFSDKTPIINCFCEDIFSNEIVTTQLKENITPENLYFLNFNYTKTIEEYKELCEKRIPSKSNYIHGNLSGINGKPIFGFGDEFDKKYIEFEDEKNNSLFKHIKSFEYLKTKNYYSLTRFIESNDFQVHIYGHSCGLSDRTMLNQIFEHKYCKSVKIFYHKIDEEQNDFTDKTYEISRHFKDKTMLRKKLVPFDLSKEMPQPKEKS